MSYFQAGKGVSPLPIFELKTLIMLYSVVKRLFDLVAALFGLIIFSPVLLVSAVLIKLTSEGPVFVENSGRVGQGGQIFRMWKFRTMVKNSHELIRTDPKFKKLFEEYKQNSFKLTNDPRVTSVGKFLRRTSIDELPQFINVVRGEMSLVGPRAYYPDELAEQRQKFPQSETSITSALRVKPGMTGLWQVSGRSDVGFEKRINMDSEYAINKSVLMEIKILLKTPIAVFKGEGSGK